MFFSLEGHAAIVTGAARGIGEGVAWRLGKAGASVVVADLDPAGAEAAAERLRQEGIQALAVAADVTDPDSVQRTLDRALDEYGRLDILVNNAGIAGKAAPVWEQSDDDWRQVLDINLTGVFHFCRAALPHMIERNYGRVVNIASLAGKEGNPNMTAYSASKAGVIALTKSLGKELAGLDIAVNCVTPAAARTSIFDQMSEEHISYMLSKIPRGRFLELDEAAAMICWLASRECSFSTGAVFDLSGGRATY
jgi:2-dehydro-3-deoxy-L-rhamnonate dehydrogenase (NAD+)